MKLKKTVAAILTVCFLFSNIPACFAVESNDNGIDKKYQYKTKKSRMFDDRYKYEYINIDWWKSFNDEYLEEYIVKAIKHNHDLKAASLAVDEYYQYVKIQFAGELPTVGAAFSPALMKSVGKSTWDWSFVTPGLVNYEADIFLKNHDKTKSAKKNYEAALEDERAAYISVASAVGVTYLNIVKLDELIKYQEEIVFLRKNIYELMKLCNIEGTVSMSDTVKADKAYVAGLTQLPDLKKNRSKLLNQLALLVGESVSDAENLERKKLSDINFTGNIPEEISSKIITGRPDYVKAEKLLEKAGIDVRVAKKEFLPSINLTGLVGFNAGDISRMFNTEQALAALAGGLVLPIFTGGKRIANLKLKKSTYDRMLETYFKTNQVAVQEINDSLVTVKYDSSKLKQNREQSELETIDLKYTKLRYDEGIISKRDLYQAEENLLSVNKLVADNTADCYIAYIGLYKATAGML